MNQTFQSPIQHTPAVSNKRFSVQEMNDRSGELPEVLATDRSAFSMNMAMMGRKTEMKMYDRDKQTPFSMNFNKTQSRMFNQKSGRQTPTPTLFKGQVELFNNNSQPDMGEKLIYKGAAISTKGMPQEVRDNLSRAIFTPNRQRGGSVLSQATDVSKVT